MNDNFNNFNDYDDNNDSNSNVGNEFDYDYGSNNDDYNYSSNDSSSNTPTSMDAEEKRKFELYRKIINVWCIVTISLFIFFFFYCSSHS